MGLRVGSQARARARQYAAHRALLGRAVGALHAQRNASYSELSQMINNFINHQSSSEDKCSSQLLEAKHQLNQLHVIINDLAAEINSTQTSISVLNVQLTTKHEELQTVE